MYLFYLYNFCDSCFLSYHLKFLDSSSLNGESDDVRIHILSNNTGYYIIGTSNAMRAVIWRYLFANFPRASCQEISSISYFAYGQLMLSDSEIFLLGMGAIASPHPLQMLKLTFGRSSTDWINKINWSSRTWASDLSESLLSDDKSKIYSFFIFGNPNYMYFVSFSVTTGSVSSNRYKSSVSLNTINGSAQSGDYILVIAAIDPTSYAMIFNIVTNEFIIKGFSETLHNWGLEILSGR